jgi:hypothetical protein
MKIMNILLKSTLILLLVSITNCSQNKIDKNEAIEISYQAQTRGSSIHIKYTDNSIYYKSNLTDKTVPLTEEQRENILASVSNIQLDDISGLKAPTDKRFSDGALIASFTITKGEAIYTSSEFDHGIPPEELKPLYELLENYSK